MRPARYLFHAVTVGSRIARHIQATVALGWLTTMGAFPTRQGDRVRFRVADVFLPIPEELPTELSQSAEMEGRIVDFSDSGLHVRVFAVVDVGGDQRVVVPVKKLHLIRGTVSENE